MKIAYKLTELSHKTKDLRSEQKVKTALIPISSYSLHQGHLTLVKRAKLHGFISIVALVKPPSPASGPAFYQDPAQLLPDNPQNVHFLREAGCDLLWLPDPQTLYGENFQSRIEVKNALAGMWEGALRPECFSEMTTLIGRLFNQVLPDVAYFGEKDLQQLRIIEQMIRDLDFSVQIQPVEVIRDFDGTALSSRHQYLTREEKLQAPLLYKTLLKIKEALLNEISVEEAVSSGKKELSEAGFRPDYLALIDKNTLQPLTGVGKPAGLIASAGLGAVRLTDYLDVA